MKKGQNYKEQLLTLSCILVDSQIKTKTQQKHFGAKFVKLLFLYIFSVFPPTFQSTFLPTHLPKKCSARLAQMRAKKQLTFNVSLF